MHPMKASADSYIERRDALVLRAVARGWIVVEAGELGLILRRGRVFSRGDAVSLSASFLVLMVAFMNPFGANSSSFLLSCGVAVRYLGFCAAAYLVFQVVRFILSQPGVKHISRERIESGEMILDI